MADSPISGLPAVTLPLIGTEEAPVVQDGITKKATAAELLAGAATAAQGAKADTALQPGGPLAAPSSGTLTSCTGLPLATGVTGLLPVVSGGTGTATPALVQGMNVTITGAWPNQTINAAGGGDALVANPLSQFAATTSAQFLGVISDETGSGLVVFNSGPTLIAPVLGTPASGTLTNCTGLPVGSGVSGLGTGVATALAVNVGSAGAPVLLNGAGGTPSSQVLTNSTGLPLTTGVTGLLPVANGGTGTATPGLVQGTNVTITGSWPNQTINATGGGGGSLTVQDEGSTLSSAVTTLNFTGAGVTATGTTTVTVNVPAGSGGNVSNSGTPTSGQAAEWVTATTVQGVAVTGTGSYVKGTAPTITLPNATGLPLATGIAGLGTGIATALAINTGSAGAPVLLNGAGGTPSSLTLTSATGLPWSTGVSGKPTTLSGYGIVDAASLTHVHGNISNAGAIGSTANLPIITGASGVLAAGAFGTAVNTFCQGNDSRLSDARTPTAHNQAWSTITATPTTRAGYGITDAAANGDIGSTGITLSGPGLAGRSTAGAGSAGLITLGTNLSFAGNVLNAAGGGGSYTFTNTQRVYGRNTAGGGPGEEVTWNQFMDWGTNVWGTFVYRGSSNWIGLAPGPAGTVLTSGGPSANLSWTSPTVASGTATLGTAAIASAANATTVTVAATGVATTDVITWGFNTNPNSVTGYNAAITTGCLVITCFPTAGNVNFVVSNPTSASITPGALTLNWRVAR